MDNIDEGIPNAQPIEGAKEATGVDEAMLEEAKVLFRKSFEIIYKDGAFDIMAEQAQGDKDIVPATAQLTATLIKAAWDQGTKDPSLLFALAIMIIAELFDGLTQLGMEIPEGSMEQVINVAMQQTMDKIPELAEVVKQMPEMQQAMQAEQAPAAAPPQQSAMNSAVQQGVMGGTQ